MQIIEKIAPAVFEYEDAKFHVKPLTAADRITLYSAKDDAGAFYASLVRLAVNGWEGIERDGQPVAFSKAALDDLFADGSRAPLLIDLGGFILERSSLSEDDATGFTRASQSP